MQVLVLGGDREIPAHIPELLENENQAQWAQDLEGEVPWESFGAA
jgi:hypothetical protein